MKKLILNNKYELKYRYFADDNGHIWSEQKQDYLTEYDDRDGYKKVVLMATDNRHRFSVHRLVLETFQPVPNMNKLQVDHIDGIKSNNQLNNLRWITAAENINNPNTRIHRRVYFQDGIHNASAKFDLESLQKIVQDINSGDYTQKEIMSKYNICRVTLRKIVLKQQYVSELKDMLITPNFKPDYARDTKGEKNGRAKLDNEKVLMIIKLIQSKKYSYKEIGDMFGVTAPTISSIKNKNTWKHLTQNITF